MADMSYVRIYVDYVETVDELSDTEAGRLFKAILHYAGGAEEVDLRGGEKLVFGIIKRQIERDAKAYAEKSEAYRAAALKREQAKRSTINQNGSQQSTANQNSAKLCDDKDKDKDKEKEKDKHTPMRERFERFWTAYPRKAGKGAAEKAWNSLKPDEALLQSMLTAITAQKSSSQWQRDNGQYIPYPATWLNQRRWEDEAAQPQAIVYAGNDDYGGDLF
jgi:hypothetical protein